MIAYNETYQTFKGHVESNVLLDQVLQKLNQNIQLNEQRAIRNSVGEVYKALNGSKIPNDARIGIEYKIPITARRIDLIISGSDGVNDNIVIVELKQWEMVEKTDKPSVVKYKRDEMVHPSWQAFSYSQTINHFNEAVELNRIKLTPCAFMHNLPKKYSDEIRNEIYNDALSNAPVFIEDDYIKLREFIEHYIKVPSKKDLLFEIEHGRIRPSKMLVDALGNMLNNNEEYVLLDEQKVVSENLYKIAQKANIKNNKDVIIVEGGAGTGKSVIAIDLLSKLISRKGMTAFYVSKSSYVRENYFAKLTKGTPRYSYLKTLFKGSGSFIESPTNQFDCLIVDEAHRLTERTKVSWFYKGENQMKEIINASKVSIFFIDPKQQIELKDNGSIEEIKKWATHFNASIHDGSSFKLKSQFRCNGSDEYIAWVDSFLYNEPFESAYEKIDYEIKVFDDIIELKQAVENKNTHNKSRMISGDVFPWVSRTDKSKIDIHIGPFSAQWNKTAAFATDPRSVDEVGCIHTTQGMEFEYVGLIIGNDLIFKDGKVQTDYSKHPDGAIEFKRPHQRSVMKEDAQLIDTLIKNTYRVLLSRGQTGCFIYCMDQPLAAYLKQRVKELIT